MDKAGQLYWEQHWRNTSLPVNAEAWTSGRTNHVNSKFAQYFRAVFDDNTTHGKSLLEIGCARSIWLSYFANTFGFRVSGIDYSTRGCEDTKQSLSRDGIASEIICADFFNPPSWMTHTYDTVVSFGVAEHFQDTAACIRAFTKLLKPGGTMITVIPNMVGLIGHIQKRVNREVFDIHVPLNSKDLRTAHEAAGLEVLDCGYFLSTNFGVCNLGKVDQRTISWLCKKALVAGLLRFSMLVWVIEKHLPSLKPNKFTSPYITCFARRPLID